MDTAVVNKETASQRTRVDRICRELVPGCEVRFSPSRNLVNFYVRDGFSGIHLTEGSGDWDPSELADKSDDELRDLVRRFSNGKIR
jgi:hypothetical protein